MRALLLTGGAGRWEPMAEALLMVADRVQHVNRVIRPAIAAGRTVISDRYAFSTMAYQGAGKGVDGDFLRALHREACGDLWPDLTLILDIDPVLGLARSRRRLAAEASTENRFEGLDLDFHRRVRAAFLALAGGGDGRCLVFDAGRAVAAVAADIAIAVDLLIPS